MLKFAIQACRRGEVRPTTNHVVWLHMHPLYPQKISDAGFQSEIATVTSASRYIDGMDAIGPACASHAIGGN
jgi:hypothetical protein